MPDFTRLELAVLDAIADETVDQAPELPGQIADARVSGRTNTGWGFITRIQVDPDRTAPLRNPPEVLGTIHADVGGLAEPVGFRALIENGRLAALEADAYGQDVSAVDFATASFGALFRITPEGESVPVPPPSPALPPQSPLHRIQQTAYPPPSPGPAPRRARYPFAHQWGERYSSEELERLKTARLPFPLHILFMAVDIAMFGMIAAFLLGMHERIPGLSGMSLETAVALFVAVGISTFFLRWALLRRFARRADG